MLDTCENISFEEMKKTQKDSDHYVEEKVVAIGRDETHLCGVKEPITLHIVTIQSTGESLYFLQ